MNQKHKTRRDEIVRRLNQPGSPSVSVISEETGIPKATLYVWLARDRRSRELSSSSYTKGRLIMNKRLKARSPSSKFSLVVGSHGLKDDALKAYCDSNGVTLDELLSWRDLALSGIEVSDRDGLGKTRKEHDHEMASLKEDLRRKNDALAETAALLVLQKKTLEILGGKR